MERIEDRETGEELLKVVIPGRKVPHQSCSPVSMYVKGQKVGLEVKKIAQILKYLVHYAKESGLHPKGLRNH